MLIVRTTATFVLSVVGKVSEAGQQDFSVRNARTEQYRELTAAIAQARRLVLAPDQRIFVRNIDTNEWSEIPCDAQVRSQSSVPGLRATG